VPTAGRPQNGCVDFSRFVPYALVAAGVAEAAYVGRSASAIDQTTTLLLVILCTLPASMRGRFPVAMTVIVPVFFVILVSTGVRPPLATIGALLWVYYLAAIRYPQWVSLLLAAPFVLHVIAPFDGTPPASVGTLALVAMTTATLAIGEAQGKRKKAIAERDATLRENLAMAERARIARELHDIVAHHVSMIAVQAETARLTTPDLPDLGKQRFAEIGSTAREALTQMRSLLGILRQERRASREPQPSLAHLDDLVAEAKAAGDPVTLTVLGVPRRLPPGTELAAYRIVQEALTNVRRHAPSAATEVTLEYEDDEVAVRIRDHGPGPGRQPADGLGLLGMRERASLAGGTLLAQAALGGGFVVEARLPHRITDNAATTATPLEEQ
jgi:signal transduction histidine kinase